MRVGAILFVFIDCCLAHGRCSIKYLCEWMSDGKYLVQVVGSLAVLTGVKALIPTLGSPFPRLNDPLVSPQLSGLNFYLCITALPF